MRKTGRIACLDELRGLDLLVMIYYHALWNLQYIFGRPRAWYISWQGAALQFCICVIFLLLAGACTHFCRAPYKRFLLLAGVALGITVVTTLFSYDSRIVFGIIHHMAVCQLLYAILRPVLKRIPPVAGAIGCAVLFALTYRVPRRLLGLGVLTVALPDAWYTCAPLSILGFLSPDFFSADYFPIIPYAFAFFCGHFLGHWLDRIPDALCRPHCRPLGWLGRHSLLIYLVHQPVLMGVMTLIFH